MENSEVSRREILNSIGAAGAGALAAGTGTVSANDDDDNDRHIVGAASRAAKREAKRKADSVHRVIHLGPYPTAVAGEYSEENRRDLKRRNDVEYVEEDVTHEIVEEVLPWGIDRTDADVAHTNGETGGDNSDGDGGADIAIIDTGIDDDHPDLHGNLATPLGDDSNHKAFTGCVGLNCNYAWSDDNDHGTHVSGTADAIDNTEGVIGVSTDATLHAAKVCDSLGLCVSSDIADALRWTADNGYDVANLSLGGSYSETIDNAGKYAYDNGVLLVAAAGNDGPCSGCVSYPAANEEFIAASATSCDDSLADFSSTGPEVELAAPGDNIYSSVIGGYDTFSGTSMATPHVSGAGAQLMDNGYLNATQSSSDAESTDPYPTSPGGARGRLQDSAEDIGLGGNDQGEGLVDVAAALGFDSSDDGTGTGPNCGSGGGGDGGGGGTAPTASVKGVSEVDSRNPHAEFDISWSAGDDDGDLDSVTVSLHDDTDGQNEDSTTIDVSGGSASGTTRIKAKHDEGSTNEYTATVEATDSNGNTGSDSATFSENGS